VYLFGTVSFLCVELQFFCFPLFLPTLFLIGVGCKAYCLLLCLNVSVVFELAGTLTILSLQRNKKSTWSVAPQQQATMDGAASIVLRVVFPGGFGAPRELSFSNTLTVGQAVAQVKKETGLTSEVLVVADSGYLALGSQLREYNFSQKVGVIEFVAYSKCFYIYCFYILLGRQPYHWFERSKFVWLYGHKELEDRSSWTFQLPLVKSFCIWPSNSESNRMIR
jgi:hypothetical protein